jgi:MFS transporter, DHA1 family, inner membrane transport protein
VGVALGVIASAVVIRFGCRRPLLWAMFGGAVLSALQALLPPLSVLAASRVIEGASHLIIVVAAPTLIAHIAPEQWRSAAMTLWATFFGVAYAVMAWLGLPLAKAYGVPSLLVAHAVFMVVIGLIVLLILNHDATAIAAGEKLSPANVWKRHLQTYSSAHVAAPAMGWLFYTLSFVAILTVLPLYLDETARSLVQVAGPLAGIASSMTFGLFLVRWLGSITTIVTGFLLSAVAAICMWIVQQDAWPALFLLASLGLVQGASFTAIPALNPGTEQRTLASGALAQMGNLGNLLGTVVLLYLTEAYGLGGLVAFALTTFACGAVVHLLLAMARKAPFPS